MFQTNVISYISANIIYFIQKHDSINVYIYLKYFIIISSIYVLLYNYYKYFQNKILSTLNQWIKYKLIEIILLINNENLNGINFNKLSTPVNRIASVCYLIFSDFITYLLPNITFFLIITLYFLYKDFYFGLSFILINFILVIYLYMNWNCMMNANKQYEKNINDNETYILEILNNIDKIIYRGQMKNELDIFHGKTNNAIDSTFQFYSNIIYNGFIMNLILFFILFIFITYLIKLHFNKKINTTIFITFFTILLIYRDKMTGVIQQIPDFVEFMGRTQTIMQHFKNMDNDYQSFFDKKKDKDENENSKELPFNSIRFENIVFKYDINDNDNDIADKKEFYVFDGLNLTLNTNDTIIGILGTSGKGKSTISKLLLKMYKPDEGKILIDDNDISQIDTDYIRNNITYVNQNSKLFDRKVIENILYGCNDMDKCNEFLKIIMKYDKIQKLYQNIDIYQKNTGALGENLSGGQRMIVNVIGGLINPSPILILDEPSNGLDMELKQELIGIIRHFKKYKKSIIIITHDNHLFNLFDQTIKI